MAETHLPPKQKVSGSKKNKPVTASSSGGPNEEGDKMEVDASTQETLDLLCAEDIKEHAKLIEKSMVTKETRFLNRVLRSLSSLRTKLNIDVLQKAISICCGSDQQG